MHPPNTNVIPFIPRRSSRRHGPGKLLYGHQSWWNERMHQALWKGIFESDVDQSLQPPATAHTFNGDE